MQNEVAERAYLVQKKEAEIGIREANFVYFGFLLVSSLMPLVLVLLFGLISVDVCIGIGLGLLGLSIPLFFVAQRLSKRNNRFKALYFVNFLFISFSVCFSALAISGHLGAEPPLIDALYTTLILALLAVLDLVILSLGTKERTLFAVGSLTFVGALVYGIIMDTKGFQGFSVPMIIFSVSGLMLHLSMLIFVCNGSGFYAIMTFFYLLFAFVALIVAIIIIGAEGGDCSCDCGDCGLTGEGGRRNKLKNKFPPTDNPILK